MTVKHIEYNIQTPSGSRVLTEIQPGKGFAVVRPGFGPGDINMSSQRLQLCNAFDSVHVSTDGTFINYRHLWSMLVQMAQPNKPLNLNDAAAFLFYPQLRLDLHPKLMRLFKTFDHVDIYWMNMAKHGYYDPETKSVHRVNLKGN